MVFELPFVHGYLSARDELIAYEERYLSVSRRDRTRITGANFLGIVQLREWKDDHAFVYAKDAPGVRVVRPFLQGHYLSLRLIADRLCDLAQEYRAAAFSGEQDLSRAVRDYLDRVAMWTTIAAQITTGIQAARIQEEFERFFTYFTLRTHDVMSDVYWDGDSINIFAQRTQGSVLQAHAGALAARALYRQWHESKADGVLLAADNIFLDCGKDFFDIPGCARAFVEECYAIRSRYVESESFATAGWYMDHGLTDTVAELTHSSEEFSHAISRCGEQMHRPRHPQKPAGDQVFWSEPLTLHEQLFLLSPTDAARAVANRIFFGIGNNDEAIALFLDVVDIIEETVRDRKFSHRRSMNMINHKSCDATVLFLDILQRLLFSRNLGGNPS